MKTLYQMLLAAGYPESQMAHHESDLYIFVTQMTQRVVNQWCKDSGYHRHLFVNTFQDQITGRMMFDVAFAYDPWWEKIDNSSR